MKKIKVAYTVEAICLMVFILRAIYLNYFSDSYGLAALADAGSFMVCIMGTIVMMIIIVIQTIIKVIIEKRFYID